MFAFTRELLTSVVFALHVFGEFPVIFLYCFVAEFSYDQRT